MKKVGLFISLLIMIGGIIGCSSSSNNKVDVSFDDIYDEIKDKVADDIGEGFEGYQNVDLLNDDSDDAELYQEMISLETDGLENAKILGTLINVNADEIILIEALDEESLKSAQVSLEDHLEDEYQVWEKYLPDQFEKVDNNIIKTKGDFLIYITYENPEAIEDIFDSHF